MAITASRSLIDAAHARIKASSPAWQTATGTKPQLIARPYYTAENAQSTIKPWAINNGAMPNASKPSYYSAPQNATPMSGLAPKNTTPVSGTAPRNATPNTSYISPTGERVGGYNIGGKIYKDAAGTQRIENGSKVTTNGGSYVMVNGVGVPMDTSKMPGYSGLGGGTAPNAAPNVQRTAAPTGSYTVDGKTHQGYNIGGQVFTDAAGTQRVPTGAIVNTNGGQFLMTPSGGVKTMGNIMNSYDNGAAKWIAEMNAGRDAQADAIDAANQMAIENINAGRYDVDEREKAANAAAYRTYLASSNPYGPAAQARAAAGLANSGFSETSQVSMGNTYQTALQQNIAQKNKMLFELDAAVREAQLSGDFQRANAISAYAKQIAAMGMDSEQYKSSLGMQMYGVANNDAWKTKDYNRDEERFEYGKTQDEIDNALQQAQFDEDKRRYERDWQLQHGNNTTNTVNYTGGGSGSSGGKSGGSSGGKSGGSSGGKSNGASGGKSNGKSGGAGGYAGGSDDKLKRNVAIITKAVRGIIQGEGITDIKKQKEEYKFCIDRMVKSGQLSEEEKNGLYEHFEIGV